MELTIATEAAAVIHRSVAENCERQIAPLETASDALCKSQASCKSLDEFLDKAFQGKKTMRRDAVKDIVDAWDNL